MAFLFQNQYNSGYTLQSINVPFILIKARVGLSSQYYISLEQEQNVPKLTGVIIYQ